MAQRKDYEAKIAWSTRELSGKEKVMYKDTSDSNKLADLTVEGAVLVDVDVMLQVDIHNEKVAEGENKDYSVYVIVDKNGAKYHTSSESLMTSATDIIHEMEGEEEPWQLKIFSAKSKNGNMQNFLTCSLV